MTHSRQEEIVKRLDGFLYWQERAEGMLEERLHNAIVRRCGRRKDQITERETEVI